MNRIQWEFNPAEDKGILECGTDDVVLYIDDIKPEVITYIVNMWNDEVETSEILKTVYKDVDNVSPDEYDYLEQQLVQYEEISSSKAEPVTKPVIEQKMEDKAVIEPGQMSTGDNREATTKGVSSLTPAEEKTAMLETTKRSPRGTNKKVATSKLSPADIIESMREKIALVEYIAAIEIADIPAGTKMSKEGREVLISLRNTVDDLKASAIQKIQEL